MEINLKVVALSSLVVGGVAIAEDDVADMDAMVVTAAGYEQKLVDAPASVTVVSREELQATPFGSLADALRNIEGIDVGSGQDKNGNISITMRGLPSQYTLILIDGRRQSDVGNIGPNNFGNAQFMYMPPLEAIERIEVVRGPMSTLYGADAMGGVINIITRKNLDELLGSVTLSSNIQLDDQYGNDNKVDFFLTGPTGVENLSFSVRGGYFDRENSAPTYSENLLLPDGSIWTDEGSFGDRKVVAAENVNTGFSLNYQVNEQHSLAFEYDVAKQRYDNTRGQTGTLDSPVSLWRLRGGVVNPRVGYARYQKFDREQMVLAHVATLDKGTWTTNLTRSTSENHGRSLPLTVEERLHVQSIWDQAVIDQGMALPELTDEIYQLLEQTFLPREKRPLKIDNFILNSSYESSFKNHYYILGMQYFNADMEDGAFGFYGDGYQAGTTQKHRQWAVFAEDSIDLSSSTTATIGLRYDDHNVFGGQVSPRVYLNYNPGNNWVFKGGISTGYKTPQPEQLFSGIVGFGGQGTIPFVGTPDLQPETSINYEMAAYFDGDGRFKGNATLFFNDFKDKIITQDNLPNCELVSTVDDCVDVGPGWAELGMTSFRQAANVDKSQTFGIELAARFDFTDNWYLNGNYTYTDSEVLSGRDEGLPLVNTPEHMINATLNWTMSDRSRLSLVSEIRSKRFRGTADVQGPQGPVTEELFYKSYELWHLAYGYNYSDGLSFNARINNLLDDDLSSRSCLLIDTQDDYDCVSDYNTSQKARSVWLSVSYQF
ncbi:TonB-dependent receptor domain-containing protein [Marinicella rhabdoformis]|uniref:TonB-dependent receptor domain-containing protein n=1 Tax=Marinicella rhabdoformis TaxID=2580566 RepID=UPI0012AECADF|nr:TonB-dependent receptor [Marinicella rhabdoformis]